MHTHSSRPLLSRRNGAALIIVLAFVVMLTVLVVAFFSRAISERGVSNSSANETKVDAFAQGAISTVVGDFEQEVAMGSSGSSAAGVTIYAPIAPADAAPCLALQGNSTVTSFAPNLLKRSAYNQPFYKGMSYYSNPSAPSRATNLSTTGTSLNGRSISLAEWNKPLLLPKANPSGTDVTPDSTQFAPPDWILVTRSGANLPKSTTVTASMQTSASGTGTVVGRYAYVVYNEGGLLDANVAGYPSTVPLTSPPSASLISNQTMYKTALSYADLTQIGLSQPQVDQIVGWRNNATTLAAGSASAGYSFPNAPATSDNYLALGMRNSTNFLATSGTAINPSGATDHTFVSRQQLIDFLLNGVAQTPADQANLGNALQYLGTFSRSLNQPSYWPDPNRPPISQGPATSPSAGAWTYPGGNSAYGADITTVNPPFRSIRVSGAFARNDGTPAAIGEPLVKKRFALNRLAWITYKGESANLISSNPSDPLITQYLADGITQQMLQEGTPNNIKNYFGLTWVPASGGGTGGYWTYDHGISSSGSPIIGSLSQVAAANREPDFFELLKAGICAGSLGKAWTGNGVSQNLTGVAQQLADTRVDLHILQIGVNIIDEASPDSFPTQIVFNAGTTSAPANTSFWGKKSLPYLSGIAYTAIVVTAATSPTPLPAISGTYRPPQSGTWLKSNGGLQVALDVPIVWNPYQTNTTSVPSALAPTQLRVAVTQVGSSTETSQAENFTNTVLYTTGTSTLGIPPGTYTSDPIKLPWIIGNYQPQSGSVNLGADPPTALYFSNSSSLYQDPTPLWQPGISGSNLSIDSANLILTQGIAGATVNGIPELKGGGKYVGFFAGQYPETMLATGPGAQGSGTICTVCASEAASTGYPLVCSLEYNAGGNWIPYMQYNTLSRDYSGFSLPYSNDQAPGTGGAIVWWGNNNGAGFTACSGAAPRCQSVEWDPRTGRWGNPADVSLATTTPVFLDSGNTMIPSLRPSGAAVRLSHGDPLASFGWNDSSGGPTKPFPMGNVCQNIFPSNSNPSFFYYQDADNVTRRGMAGAIQGFSPSSPTGIPLATVYNTPANLQNRPVMLNRPFRNVAELGYVFSDTPWKNLDFFTSESGDAALLDIFCINEDTSVDALAAGKVDLNTQQPKVIQAILAGAYRDELGVSGTLASTEVAAIANALVTRTSGTGPAVTGKGPLANVADLVGRYSSGFTNPNGQPFAGFTDDFLQSTPLYSGASTAANNVDQRFLETAVRALSDTGMAGTWNLLIDIVAQTGRYPASTTSLANFMVEGERHYWVHMAIDRQNGAVIDQQIEEVNE